MFIELLIVAAILMFLNAKGYLDFNSPNAIGLSVTIVLGVVGVTYVLWYFVARGVVDSLFGFGSWVPRRPLRSSLTSQAGPAIADDRFEELKKAAKKSPQDPDISRQLAEQLLKRGMTDEFVTEKLRMAKSPLLSTAEKCAIFNRLTDVSIQKGANDEALDYLNQIVKSFPNTAEAENAKVRIHRIEQSTHLSNGEQA
jgi:hypothetical protein